MRPIHLLQSRHLSYKQKFSSTGIRHIFQNHPEKREHPITLTLFVIPVQLNPRRLQKLCPAQNYTDAVRPGFIFFST